MTQYSGKIIRKTPVVPSQTSASGVWTQQDAAIAVKSNTWPIAGVPDPISRSVRLRSSASAYFNRTPASAGNRTTWTWSAWFKRGVLSSQSSIFGAVGSSSVAQIRLQTGDAIVFNFGNSVTNYFVTTTQVFRDPSAWYHIVFVSDTTQATAANRCKIYINGVAVTAFVSGQDPSGIPLNQQSEINTATAHYIGRDLSSGYFDGYLTEINFIDGQALTPSSFGTTNTLTGAWIPMPYTGTYGTNGFYLNFKDNTSTTTIGYDYSGNSNNWTANNISLTAGTTYDSMIDVPTPWIGYNTDGGVSVTRGNYCVLNALNNTGTLSNANLTFTGTDKAVVSTIQIPTSGKYYFEATCTTVANFSTIGIANIASQASVFNGVIASANFRTYNSGGEKADSSRTASWGSTFTSGDVIGVAVDMDNGAIYFAKNNTWQASGVPTSGASKTGAAFTDLISSGITWTPIFSAQNISGVWNPTFGQRPFSYTPPTGFQALCTTNLPTPTIANGANYMAATLYTGNNTTGRSITGVGFQPDLVWIKSRAVVHSHIWDDSVRGAGKFITSNTTNAEQTDTNVFTSFNSDGFTVGNDATTNGTSSETYVAWSWKASGSTSSNTSGSITSTVSVNATAGFSIVTYTGTGANATVGHGLGVAPKMVIIKRRDAAGYGWVVGNTNIGWGNVLYLNSTNASGAATAVFNSTAPGSSVITLGNDTYVNASTGTYVAYCWSEVAGFSKFGSYTGNGATDGPFINTGFRPRWIMIKRTDSTENWQMYDTSRTAYNVMGEYLLANSSGAGATITVCDFLSNGFKIRVDGTNPGVNTSGGTYIYAAFAENPFNYSNAR